MLFIFAVLRASIALFIIIDPVGLIPIFMALTKNMDCEERSAILTRSAFVAFTLLLLFALVGAGILNLFGITISDFKIAGGILLLVIALRIISAAHYGQGEDMEIGVVPLGIPLLAGPGAITTTIVLIGSYGLPVTLIALVVTFVLSLLIFRFVDLEYRLIGRTGADVVAKVMGMLLAAIAVQYIQQGIHEVFHL